MIPFTYKGLQEAARVGASWAAIELNHDSWSALAAPSNVCNTAYAANPDGTLVVNSATIHTLVREVASKLAAVNKAQAAVQIPPPLSSFPGCHNQAGIALGGCTEMPATVVALQGHNTIGGTPDNIGIVDAPSTSITVTGNGSRYCSAPDLQAAIADNDWSTGDSSDVCVMYERYLSSRHTRHQAQVQRLNAVA